MTASAEGEMLARFVRIGLTRQQAIDAEIGSWLDRDMWNDRDAEIERARALL